MSATLRPGIHLSSRKIPTFFCIAHVVMDQFIKSDAINVNQPLVIPSLPSDFSDTICKKFTAPASGNLQVSRYLLYRVHHSGRGSLTCRVGLHDDKAAVSEYAFIVRAWCSTANNCASFPEQIKVRCHVCVFYGLSTLFVAGGQNATDRVCD